MARSANKLDVIASLTTFGDLLRYLRQRQQMTQRELALAVGYSIARSAAWNTTNACPMS